MAEPDLARFERRIEVRPLRPEDFDAIIALQTVCFPGMKPWTREQLASHVAAFPEGQICVEYDGVIIGSAASLIVDFDDYDKDHDFNEITADGTIGNHDPEGHNLYGMEVMVHPDHRGKKIGRRLYEERKRLVERLNLESIVIEGRIPNYHEHAAEMTVREYVDEVLHRNIYDPVLTFQLMNGFQLKWINKGYLPGDKESHSNAAVLEWRNIEYRPRSKRHFKTSHPVRICTVQYEMRRLDDFEGFARQCEYFTDVAAGYHSDFVMFPELLTTQLMSLFDAKAPSDAARKLTAYTDRYIRLFRDLAVRYNINIIGGSHFVEEEGDLYNHAYLFRRDGSIGRQAKIHITPNERQWWGLASGDRIRVFDTDAGRIAICICYDIEFPEMARLAVEAGARMIFVPFCTENRQGYLRVQQCARARAIENQVYVAIAGTVGNLPQVTNMDIQYAQSGIYSPVDFPFPWDGVVGECAANTETVVVGDVDLEVLKRHRKKGTVTQLADRRRDLYDVTGTAEVVPMAAADGRAAGEEVPMDGEGDPTRGPRPTRQPSLSGTE